MWAIKTLPPAMWVRTPTRELAMLRIPLARFYGEKIRRRRSWAWSSRRCSRSSSQLIGLGFPVAIPAVGLARAGGGDVLPARLQRRRRRAEGPARVRPGTRRLHRPGRPGTQQRLRRPAGDGGPPPRSATPGCSAGSSEELARTRWSGLPPWDALHTLADELGLPELDDFADIMRLSGEEGASVYTNLRARSAAMRTAMLNDEIAEANAVGERMTIPGSCSASSSWPSSSPRPCCGCSATPDNHHPYEREPIEERNHL